MRDNTEAGDVVGCKPHHWIIETPTGAAENKAECKKCGMKRTYPASISGLEFVGFNSRPVSDNAPPLWMSGRK